MVSLRRVICSVFRGMKLDCAANAVSTVTAVWSVWRELITSNIQYSPVQITNKLQ